MHQHTKHSFGQHSQITDAKKSEKAKKKLRDCRQKIFDSRKRKILNHQHLKLPCQMKCDNIKFFFLDDLVSCVTLGPCDFINVCAKANNEKRQRY